MNKDRIIVAAVVVVMVMAAVAIFGIYKNNQDNNAYQQNETPQQKLKRGAPECQGVIAC